MKTTDWGRIVTASAIWSGVRFMLGCPHAKRLGESP